MKINEILKPCPFCGRRVEVARLEADQIDVTSIEVRCHCGAEVMFDSDDHIYDWTGAAHQMGLTAIDKWNRRTDHERGEWINKQALLKQIDIDSDGEPGYYGDTWKFVDTINNMPGRSDLISRCDLFNRLATIPAPPEANDFKTEIYKVIQGMETVDGQNRCCEACGHFDTCAGNKMEERNE